jgi:hypothetical protein
MVFDISHGFMCRRYFESGQTSVLGLELVRNLFRDKGQPEKIANDYEDIRAASPHIGWIHLNDCTGIYGDQEGLPLFQRDSIVDWMKMIPILRKMNVPMILEIRSAERDFALLDLSLRNFHRMWG